MGAFKFSEPSASIQIELPDGRLIEGPRGSTLEELTAVIRPHPTFSEGFSEALTLS